LLTRCLAERADANKSGYIDYYDMIIDNNLLAKNGLLCVDNGTFDSIVLSPLLTHLLYRSLLPVLFKGYVHPNLKDAYRRPYKKKYSKQEDKLMTKEEMDDARYQKIGARLKEFNKHVFEDPTTEQLILPMFDGMMLIWKRLPGRNAWAVD
jgi:predicted O-methyltransferase YrrM